MLRTEEKSEEVHELQRQLEESKKIFEELKGQHSELIASNRSANDTNATLMQRLEEK